MKFEKNTLTAILFCLVFFLGYEFYLNKKYPNRFKRPSTPKSTETLSAGGGSLGGDQSKSSDESMSAAPTETSLNRTEKKVAASTIKFLSPEELRIETSTSIYEFDQKNGSLRSLVLKNYKEEDRTSQVEAINDYLKVQAQTKVNDPFEGPFEAERIGENSIKFSREDRGWKLSHTYSVDESDYGLQVELSWTNLEKSHRNLNSIFLISDSVSRAEPAGWFQGIPLNASGLVVSRDGEIDHLTTSEQCKKAPQELILHEKNRRVDFYGSETQYFARVFLPQTSKLTYKIIKSAEENDLTGDCRFTTLSAIDQGEVKAGQSVTLNLKAWIGPKKQEEMVTFDQKLGDLVDFGFFSSISKILLYLLKLAFSFLGNWGLAIIAVTVFIKIIFYPLQRQAAIAMHQQKKLQPEMNRIKESFKDDPQRQSQELMKFMTANKVNPLKGCLPILPTIPVFIAFWRALGASIELRQTAFFGWITDLSVPDPYYIIPMLLIATMFAQHKLMPMAAGMDKAQQRIMMLMPLMFGAIMIQFPAGLALYSLTNTVVSIAQQQWINRKLA